MRMVLMLVKLDDFSLEIIGVLNVFLLTKSRQNFFGLEEFGMVNGNFAVHVFKEPERSKQYAMIYTASKSRNAEGMLHIMRIKVRMTFKLQNLSEKKRKTKTTLAIG